MGKIKKDQVLGIIGLAFSVLVGIFTMQLQDTAFIGDPGPRLMPWLAAILIAGCSIVLIVRPTKTQGKFLTREQWGRALKLFAVYVLNFVLMWLFGFNISVPIMLFICTFIMSKVSNRDITPRKRILISIIYAAVGFTVLYLLYVVALKAVLPKGVLLQALH